MDYSEFKEVVRDACQRPGPTQGLAPIPELRRLCATRLDRESFDNFVLRLNQDGLIHLLTHVESDKLPEEVRRDCIPHPSGWLLYWIRWL